MKKTTGYVITEQNAALIAHLTGKELKIIVANLGWVAVYLEDPYPRWVLNPKNVAERTPGFEYVDSALNGLPARSEKAIRQEWKEVNEAYRVKLAELRKELDRAILRDGEQKEEENNA